MNNVATIVSRKFAEGERADYGGPDELMETFARTTPHVQEMLSYVGKDKNWLLHDRDPLPGWTRGNVTLLGDAAHPTLQYLAQGACMAMEDAVCLAQEIERQPADLAAAFLKYQQRRYLRTARVQLTARLYGHVYHASDATADLRNAFLRARTPEQTFESMAWIYESQLEERPADDAG